MKQLGVVIGRFQVPQHKHLYRAFKEWYEEAVKKGEEHNEL